MKRKKNKRKKFSIRSGPGYNSPKRNWEKPNFLPVFRARKPAHCAPCLVFCLFSFFSHFLHATKHGKIIFSTSFSAQIFSSPRFPRSHAGRQWKFNVKLTSSDGNIHLFSWLLLQFLLNSMNIFGIYQRNEVGT